MPLTFSHPALILPLTLRKSTAWSATGLIIGSMAPDFEYFFRMKAYSHYSHSLLGILYFDLPLTVLLSIIFHQLVKGPLIANVPRYFKIRCYDWFNYNFLDYLKNHKIPFILSAIVGSATHIFWDGFTYAGGFFVTVFPALSTKVDLGKFSLGIYKLIQYGSTLIGGLIILMYFHFLPKGKNPFPFPIQYTYWLIILLVTVAVAYQSFDIGFTSNRVANYSVTAITGGLVGIVVSSLLFRIYNPAKYRPASISDS